MSTMTSTVSDGGIAVDAVDPQVAALQAGGISLAETLEIALKSLTANKLRTLTAMRWGSRCGSAARASRSSACWRRKGAAASARRTMG